MAAVAEKAGSFGHAIDRTAEPLIRARGVWKIFGRNAGRIVGTDDADLPRAELRAKHDCVAAVRDVSFEVWPREVFVVMGLSGSGKSTLVRTLIRLIEPTAGEIEIDGRDVTSAGAAELRSMPRHTSSRVFQHFGLLAHRRVIDNVAFGLEIQGMAKAERLRRAEEVLRPASLAEGSNSFTHHIRARIQHALGLCLAIPVDPKCRTLQPQFTTTEHHSARPPQHQ